MLKKVLGALADGVMPKTQDWLTKQVHAHVGELLRKHEGGVSYIDHYRQTEKIPGLIAGAIAHHLEQDLASFFKPERKGDLKVSVHYRGDPRPGLSVGVYLIERDHIYDAVFTFYDLDFVPEPFVLVQSPKPKTETGSKRQK